MSALKTPRQEPLIPPEPPVEGSCCGRGCEWCVWVYYDQALRRYEAARAQGQESQDSAQDAGVSGKMTQSPETGV
jgi:hypothetical protein